jgi:hypothetical protein
MTDRTKLEAMLVYLLNERSSYGKPWVSIALEGFPTFTRADLQDELWQLRHPRRWYHCFFRKTKQK